MRGCFKSGLDRRPKNRSRRRETEPGRNESELSSQENLKDVMSWAFSHSPGTFIPTVVAEVIVQDEFTHDVIVAWRDGLVLVYDTT